MVDLQNFPRILDILKLAWDTSGGAALRDLLWSLRNQGYYTNLWLCMSDLGLSERSEVVQLLLMPGHVRDRTLEAILRETGELPAEGYEGGRIDEYPTRSTVRIAEGGREV